jgi:hypothetical protein
MVGAVVAVAAGSTLLPPGWSKRRISTIASKTTGTTSADDCSRPSTREIFVMEEILADSANG